MISTKVNLSLLIYVVIAVFVVLSLVRMNNTETFRLAMLEKDYVRIAITTRNNGAYYTYVPAEILKCSEHSGGIDSLSDSVSARIDKHIEKEVE